MRKAFRPEFVNRLDEIVVFQRLERSQIRQIVDIQLGQFAQAPRATRAHSRAYGPREGFLGEAGFDPQYGARPLKRAIQRYLEDALAKRVLAGEFPPGTTIRVDGDASAGFRFEAKVQN